MSCPRLARNDGGAGWSNSLIVTYFLVLPSVDGRASKCPPLPFHLLSQCLLQDFSQYGDALRASPDSEINAVTFVVASTRISFGINEASLLRHEIIPILVVSFPCLKAVLYLSHIIVILPAGFLVVLILPKMLP